MNRFGKQDDRENQGEADARRPLREYSEGPPGLSPSMQWFRLEKTAYWLLPLLIFFAILFGGIYLVVKFDLFNMGSEASLRSVPYLDPFGNILVPELMESHVAAIGGRNALENIRSLRYKGRIVEDTGEINFQILISSPDKGMIITEPGEDRSQRLVLNGDVAWQVSERGDGERNVTLLGEKDTASLKWSLRLHNTFRDLALRGRSEGFSARKIDFLERPCFELTKTLPEGSRFVAVLDAETLYLLKLYEPTQNGESRERLELVYDDHRRVSGIVEAYKTKTYKEGELYNEIFIDYVEIDPGLVSSLFQVPEKLVR
ncbi:MAG TPA: hypothetical protein VJ952_09930 [Opitutales bacterium]|nr:hypothetical protein [Opitutales bacterium]